MVGIKKFIPKKVTKKVTKPVVKYKYSRDGIKFIEKCPLCGSDETVIATYADGKRYVECEECYTVLGRVVGKQVRMS